MERTETIPSEIKLMQSQADFLRKCGLWHTDRSQFRLSLDVLELSASESQELVEISNLVAGHNGLLENTVKLFRMTSNPQFASSHAGGAIRKALCMGISKAEMPLQTLRPLDIPFLTRLDLVAVDKEKDSDSAFQIVEIEGDKSHAFGYCTLPAFLRNLMLKSNLPLGLIDAFKEELRFRNAEGKQILHIVGELERFYLPELQVFARIAQSEGIDLIVAGESEIQVTRNGLKAPGLKDPATLLVSIPRLRPFGRGGSRIDAKNIYALYEEGVVDCMIPPKRFLGNKSLLGIVSNAMAEPELESYLNEIFGEKLIAGLRRFIPQTIQLTWKNRKEVLDMVARNSGEWIIKETTSSGMKGVSLSNGENKRERMIKEATDSPFSYIVQRKVQQKTQTFRFSEPNNSIRINEAPMFMRISPFVTRSGIATVGLTARETPDVHGATDAIQIPVIF